MEAKLDKKRSEGSPSHLEENSKKKKGTFWKVKTKKVSKCDPHRVNLKTQKWKGHKPSFKKIETKRKNCQKKKLRRERFSKILDTMKRREATHCTKK